MFNTCRTKKYIISLKYPVIYIYIYIYKRNTTYNIIDFNYQQQYVYHLIVQYNRIVKLL